MSATISSSNLVPTDVVAGRLTAGRGHRETPVRDEAAGSFETSGPELPSLLERQRDVLRRLQALTERQRSQRTVSDPRVSLVMLAERQRLVREIEACNESLAPLRRDWAGTLARLNVEQRRRVDDLLVENERILSPVVSSSARIRMGGVEREAGGRPVERIGQTARMDVTL